MLYDIEESNGIEKTGLCCLQLRMVEKYSVEIIVLKGSLKGRKYKGESYVHALNIMRLDLEEKGIFLACHGGVKSFHASKMSLEMSDGLVGYSLTLGRQASRKDMLKTFEMNKNFKNLGTVEEQKIYYEKWMDSIVRPCK